MYEREREVERERERERDVMVNVFVFSAVDHEYFRNRQNSEPSASFSGLFRSEYK
jgi:hypothetical protein